MGIDTRVRPIYQLADNDISVPANWISVSVILVSVFVSVSANVDISYIGIG